MGLPFAPWHMWGGSIDVAMQANGAARAENIQIANINYKRPETWTFFFAAELTALTAPAADTDFRVHFDLILGMGRTYVDTRMGPPFTVAGAQPFCRMLFRLPAGSISTAIQFKRWTTQTRTPLLENDDATSRLPLTHFPAEDIRAMATCFQDTAGATVAANLRLTAMFAPRTHIRPAWFEAGSEAYQGNEQ